LAGEPPGAGVYAAVLRSPQATVTIDPALLAQIRAAPDDDTVRLVYADRLLELGDPYGEFIALQCAATRTHDGDLAARANALFDAHGDTWLEHLGLARGEATWERGFVEAISLAADRFGALPDLESRVPARRLRVSELAGDAEILADVLAMPIVRVVTALELQNNDLDDEGLRVLAAAPLAKLTNLELRANLFGADGVRALAGAPQLAGLHHLGLSHSQFDDAPSPGDDGAFALAQASHLTQVTSLGLQFWAIGVDGIRALAQAPQLAKLQTLRLAGSSIGPAGATAIAEQLTELTELDLWNSDLEFHGARAVLGLPRLVDLDLGGNELTGAIARAIVDAPNLAGMQKLWLRDNQIGDAGAGALGHLSALVSLDLHSNEISHAGVRALADRLHALSFLDISSNPLGPRGAQALADLAAVETLNVASTELGVEGARALARAPKLSVLLASYNTFGPDGVRMLAPLLSRLTRLDLKSNALTADGARALRDVPLPRLRWLDVGHNALGAEGARHLAALELPALRELRIPANQLGVEGAIALASASWLPALERLFVAPADEIGDAGLDALRAAAPKLRIAGARSL
jgi:uncharacterized protein (TIGR02996 family)